MSEYLAVAPGAESIGIDDAVLVFAEDFIHLLDGSAAEIWKLLDGATTVQDVASELAARHSRSVVLADVLRFATDLVDRGLVVRSIIPTGNGIRASAHVAWTVENDGSVVIADLLTGTRQTLSSTASRIWSLTLDGAPMEAILAHLANEFADAPPHFGDDVDQLLGSLIDQGLMCRSGGGQSRRDAGTASP